MKDRKSEWVTGSESGEDEDEWGMKLTCKKNESRKERRSQNFDSRPVALYSVMFNNEASRYLFFFIGLRIMTSIFCTGVLFMSSNKTGADAVRQWPPDGRQAERAASSLSGVQGPLFYFLLPRNAMRSADCAVARCPSVYTSVCLSVCLQHAGILSKQLNISSNFFHRRRATPFYFFVRNGMAIFRRGSSFITGRQMQWYEKSWFSSTQDTAIVTVEGD